jgi:hypothetical protein
MSGPIDSGSGQASKGPTLFASRAVRCNRYLFFGQTKNSFQRSVDYAEPDAILPLQSPAGTLQPEIGRRGIMTRNRNLLFAATAAAALMMSATAFAQGAAPSPEAFPPYAPSTSYQPVKGRIVMQSGRVRLHEGRFSAEVPYSGDYGYTDTSREWQIHAN